MQLNGSTYSTIKNVIDLALYDYFDTKLKSKQFIKILESDNDLLYVLDFYTSIYSYDLNLNLKKKYRKYKKNVLIGEIIEFEHGMIYIDRYNNIFERRLSTIRKYLKESNIMFTYVGKFIIFENLENKIPVNKKIITRQHSISLFKLNVTQIGKILVQSNIATRLFIFFKNKIYVEKKIKGTMLNHNLLSNLSNNDGKVIIELNDFPILYYSIHGEKTFSEVEERYSQELVKVLTS